MKVYVMEIKDIGVYFVGAGDEAEAKYNLAGRFSDFMCREEDIETVGTIGELSSRTADSHDEIIRIS